MARGAPAKAVLAADAAAAEAALPYQGSAAMEALGRFASLGDQPPLRTLCAAVIAAGLAGGDRRLARCGLRMLVAHSLATFAKDFVKLRVDRTRPRSKAAAGKDHVPRPGRHTSKEETSFPSGHSAGAAAVARAFARDYPEYRAPAFAAAGALALAQIPRCAHYPTDVGAGLAIGLAAEAAVDFGFKLSAPAFAGEWDPVGVEGHSSPAFAGEGDPEGVEGHSSPAFAGEGDTEGVEGRPVDV